MAGGHHNAQFQNPLDYLMVDEKEGLLLQDMLVDQGETVASKGILGDKDKQAIKKGLKSRLDKLLTNDLLKDKHKPEVKEKIREIVEKEVFDLGSKLPPSLKNALDQIVEEEMLSITGLGLIQPLLEQDIEEAWINGGRFIFYQDRKGKKHKWDYEYASVKDVYHLIDRILTPLGKKATETNTIVDAWYNGMRVTIVMDPTCPEGPSVSFRKNHKDGLSFNDLKDNNTIGQYASELIGAMVEAEFNMSVTGPTRSGKTTLLNAVCGLAPADRRYITIEDRIELKLPHPHWVSLVTRDANEQGQFGVNFRRLVKLAMSMSPDHFFLGEARDEAFFDILQAATTGHTLLLATLHTGDFLDENCSEGFATITRMETLAMMAGANITERVARNLIASGFQADIHIKEIKEGLRYIGRRVSRISGIFGIQDNAVRVEDVLAYDEENDCEKIASGPGPALMAKLLRKRGVTPPSWLEVN
ncbi:CpaF family protein [Desulforamulus aquiferis]|uniref:ATPase, T2SS/T4P/T4SS family n=1 Tax=Desulforamulus aquiferis TaxID=1397668 RepID=A0AAW7Z8Q1_9FIRM|nr:ATPase, T2SS/T4P/T4SS family [Desulforamulus aquiferis]MDO7785800.1 ATPase, T2SS/T4P/T4SS family [Desulforamulus aquiferis]